MPYNPYLGVVQNLGFNQPMQPGAMQQGQMWNPTMPTVPQQGQQLIRVTGIEGAKAYQMGPGSVVPLFDSDDDIMYVKSTDDAGFPTIRTFRFSPVEQAPAGGGQYVTREELNSVVSNIQEMIANAQQSVSATEPAAAPKPAARSRKSSSGD